MLTTGLGQAPDVSLIGDTYYAYYAVSTLGSQISDIGVATSTKLDPGSWTDHGSIGLPASSRWDKIDPNLFRQCNSCPGLLSFGSGWEGIFQTGLDSDFADASGPAPAPVAFNASRPASGGTLPTLIEASFQFWWPVSGTAYYYLFFSSGACCPAASALPPPGDEYKIMVCRATAPTGPFVDHSGTDCAAASGGTLVLASHGNVYAPGSQGVIFDPDADKVALYYHYSTCCRLSRERCNVVHTNPA